MIRPCRRILLQYCCNRHIVVFLLVTLCALHVAVLWSLHSLDSSNTVTRESPLDIARLDRGTRIHMQSATTRPVKDVSMDQTRSNKTTAILSVEGDHQSTGNKTAIEVSKRECSSACSCWRDAFNLGNDNKSPFLPYQDHLWKEASKTFVTAFRESDLKGIKNARFEYQRYTEWVQDLIQIFTPFRLRRSTASPADPHAVQELRRRLDQWLCFSKGKCTTRPSPIRIMVFGGSVTAGHDWNTAVPINVTIAPSNVAPPQYHAWPYRLQAVLQDMLRGTSIPPEAIHVENMAVSATYADVGALILEYRLFPPDYPLEGPDIVIGSYSTNEYMADKGHQGIATLKRQQEFVRQAKQLRCRDSNSRLPLVVLVDDLAVWPTRLAGPLYQATLTTQLAQWYGALGISYGNAIRDIGLANPGATHFNNEWIKERNGWRSHCRVHGGLGYHISLAWVVAFNLFHEAYESCQAELEGEILRKDIEDARDAQERLGLANIPVALIPPLNLNADVRKLRPQWVADESNATCTNAKECAFAWVSNRVAKMGTKTQVKALLEPFLKSLDGWEIGGIGNSVEWEDKVGLQATKNGGTFVFEGNNTLARESIQQLTIIVLQSYGPKWKDARVRVRLHVATRAPRVFDLEGFHEEHTSILVPYRFPLKGQDSIPPGEVFRLDFELVDGINFKILGLAFCSNS